MKYSDIIIMKGFYQGMLHHLYPQKNSCRHSNPSATLQIIMNICRCFQISDISYLQKSKHPRYKDTLALSQAIFLCSYYCQTQRLKAHILKSISSHLRYNLQPYLHPLLFTKDRHLQKSLPLMSVNLPYIFLFSNKCS